MAADNEISPDGVPSTEQIPTAEVPVVAAEQVAAEQVTNEPEVTLADFAALKDAPLMSKAGEKKEEPKKEETVKVEEKEAEQLQKEAEKTTDKTGQPIAPKKGLARDYSGLPENMVPLFKTMGNQTFDALKPFYLEAVKAQTELAELKKNPPQANGQPKIPESYVEHPEAYTLTPEYASAANAAQEAQSVLEHWRDQLDSVRNGATEFQTLVRDPKSGQIVYGANQKVDQRTQSFLENVFFNANNQAGQFQSKLASVKNEYTGKHTKLVGDIREWEKKVFDVFENEQHPLVPAYKDTLSKFPAAVQKNILAQPLAKAMTSINALVNMITELKKNGGKAAPTLDEKKAAAQKKAGPTSGGTAGADENNDEVTLDDFNKAKE